MFPSKREAAEWAAAQAAAIKTVQAGGTPDIPVAALLEKYMQEVTPRKRGRVKEALQLQRLMRDELAQVRLPQLKPAYLSAWRDRRLSEVSAASVLRDWSLLSHVFSVAVREWEYLPGNPLKPVRKPKAPPSRDRRISEAEISRLLLGLGYSREGTAKTVRARVAIALLFAIETGMRAGEILSLKWEAVRGNVAHLPVTKNGYPRNVPLSAEAVRLFGQLPKSGAGSAFNLTSDQLKGYFSQARERAQIDNLHFHDTRHEAITRLARKLDVLDLARMVGTRDLKILMVYYNATPSEIAARLG
ncbi:MAG: site-specific integrase [Betaproteobacteria bacterium]|nr:site-specific integrase [Betaproteobacteria bacterium]